MQDDMKEAVDSLAKTQTDPSLFVASNGLRLRLRRVSGLVAADAARRLKTPRPPRMFMEEKGREEENPNDPDYIEALRNYRFDVARLAHSTYFILGTKVEGALPDGVDPLLTNSWVENLQAIDPDIDIPEAGPRRYLTWLQKHALPDGDQSNLLMQVMRYSGSTLEVDVEAAQATFRDQSARDSLDGVSAPTEVRSGDLNGAGTGDSPGVRSEGSSGLRALPVASLGTPDGF